MAEDTHFRFCVRLLGMDNQDALCLVFQMLDFTDLVRVGGACRAWRACARTDPLVGTREIDLRNLPNLRHRDYDAFLGTWGARVHALSFHDDNQYSCPTHDAFRWNAAARSLVNLRALSVVVEADYSYIPMPLECRWLAILGAACPLLRSVRVATYLEDVELPDMDRFLAAAAHRLDELVLVQLQGRTDASTVYARACERVRVANGTTGTVWYGASQCVSPGGRNGRVATTPRTLHVFSYLHTPSVRAYHNHDWAVMCNAGLE
jgi:hypothetical protein